MAGGKTGKRSTMARRAESAAARWFFDHSLDMFAVVDREGLFTEINDAWERVTGWTRADLVGTSIFDLLHEDSFEEARDSRRRMKRDGHTVNQLKIRRKNGEWMWIQGRSRLDPDDQMVGTLHDITETVLQKEELEAARRNRSMLSEAAGIGSWSYDPYTDRIEWSEDILALCGWDRADIDTTEKFHAIVDPSQRESVNAVFKRGVTSGEGATIEHRLLTRDGRWLTMRATFRTEPRGRAFALKGISQDVSELVEARDAAREGERRVQALMEQARMDAWRQELALGAAEAGAFEIDHAAGSFWASEQFYRLVGRRMTFEEIALPVWPFVHRDDRGLVFETNRRWARGEENISMEFRIALPEGEERWVRCFYRLDRPTRKGVGLVLDIDARKRQELALVEAQRAAEAAAEAKAAFLANMSHEIRTPMNGVLGVLHLLKGEANVSDGGRRLLDEALSCGEMLSTLLDDVIDFERIEAGRLELQDEPVDAGELARSVFRLLEPQAKAKGLTLTLEGAEALGWVRSDPVRLRQCLFNLMGNAVKFTLAGGVTLTCARPVSGRLAFAVKDTGIGIPLDAQDRLFERFHQADASTTRRFGGSGLGLTITRKLAEMMGGEVSFFSRPGLGSTFRIEIAAPDAVAAAPSAGLGVTLLEGLRFLVVEDNPTNRMIAVKLLESLGASAQTASDGASGVAAAASAPFDLILMDIQMPDMDGLEACRRIRAQRGPCAATPIIALTANVLAHQRETYLAAGMDGVVGKPISPAALLAEIARLAAEPNATAAVA
ncbi:MAG: PAS domain-containing protein [Caulobacterales bacterium]|nr:PAS domain-containing protein [Caulobacterales bacterium]